MSYQGVHVQRGFTLVESIVVMLIISVLGATVVLRLNSKSKIAALSSADILRNGIVHAQYLALSKSTPLSVAATAAGFSVCLSTVSPCNAGTAITDPGTGAKFTEAFTDGVTMTTTGATGTASGALVNLDSIGRPSNGASLISTNPVAVYTLNGAGRTASITVRPITGFAEVSY